MSAQRLIRLGVAVLASLVSIALSWPYFRDFGYWAESRTLWVIYFTLGFVLAVYVFMVFLETLATLFEHDSLQKKKPFVMPGDAPDREGRP